MEKWKTIPNTNGYYDISNKGRIRSYHNHGHNKLKTPRLLNWSLDVSGYEVKTISVDTKPVNIKAHRVIAEAFIPNPENKPYINHLNSNPSDNRIENLEWCTASENTKHMFDTGRKTLVGENHNQSILNRKKVKEIRKIYKEQDITQKELGKKYGVTCHCISAVIRRKTWSHI